MEEEEINIERFRKEDYLSKEITLLVSGLRPENKPLWGIMTPQHMLEHLEGSFKISNGAVELTDMRHSQEEANRRKVTLMTNEPFAKNIVIGGKEPKLRDLKYKSMEEAKVSFFKQLISFFAYHDKNNNATPLHPAFGNLNYDEWLQFHFKHVRHHFDQFGLNEQ